MKRSIGILAAVFTLFGLLSTADAIINIKTAKVKEGGVLVEGNRAAISAPLTWEAQGVGTTNTNGAFKFTTNIVPQDCVGELSDGVETVDVEIDGCTPEPAAGSKVFKTGQTTSFATGDDGDFQAGTPVPSPRFTDNGDGTISDNLTGLIWLKDNACVAPQPWADALAAVNGLADGNVSCGLSDGSLAGDWRLPNRNELISLLDLGTTQPALPAGHPFTNVPTFAYWSSTTDANFTTAAWAVNLHTGLIGAIGKASNQAVTAVRGGS